MPQADEGMRRGGSGSVGMRPRQKRRLWQVPIVSTGIQKDFQLRFSQLASFSWNDIFLFLQNIVV